MPPIVLLGASGFLGRSVQDDLLDAGLQVFASSSSDCNLSDIAGTLRYFAAFQEPFLVIDCAGISRRKDDSASALERNLMMVDHLIEALDSRPCRGVAFMSTADVYGSNPELPIRESTHVAPQNYYAWGKRIAEQRLQDGVKAPVLSLRLPGMFGALDRGTSVIGRLVAQSRGNPRMTVYGPAGYRQDFVPVALLGQILRRWIRNPKAGMFNVATGQSKTMTEWAKLAAECAGQSVAIEQREDPAKPATDFVFDVSGLRVAFSDLPIADARDSVAAYVRATDSSAAKVAHG